MNVTCGSRNRHPGPGALAAALLLGLWLLPYLAGAEEKFQTREMIIDYLGGASRSLGTLAKAPPPLRLNLPFEFDSAALTPAARRQLDEVGGALRAATTGTVKIRLGGHTDQRGSDAYNLELSRRRVAAAQAYIIETFGIPAGRIDAVGYGESRPLVPGAVTEAEHALNRRVEMRPWDGAGEAGDATPLLAVVAAQPFEVDWGVYRLRDGQYERLPKDGSAVMRSGDSFAVFVRASAPCRLYLVRVDPAGREEWLFPREIAPEILPLGGERWLPARGAAYRLDERKGRETLHLVAGRAPAAALEDRIAHGAVASRGLGKIESGPPPSDGRPEAPIPGSAPAAPASAASLAELLTRAGDFRVAFPFRHE